MMSNLQEAAQQALEALERDEAAIELLRFVRCHKDRHLLPRDWLSKADEVIRYWDEVSAQELRGKTKEALRAALAKPQTTHSAECYKWHHGCAIAEVERLRGAEPAEQVAWEMNADGRTLQDNDFTHDVVLRLDGDFESDEQRIEYAQRIVDKLNAPTPREPLTDEEIYAAIKGVDSLKAIEVARAIEAAHGITGYSK